MKYKNKKVEYNGIKFDSAMERDFYIELLDLKSRGEVLEIELQPVFLLQEKFKYKGKSIRQITFIADFRIKYSDGSEIIYDVKGLETETFRLKFKMVKHLYPNLDFRCIKKKSKSWIEF